STSTGPNADETPSTRSATPASLVTSARNAAAMPPSRWISSATESACESSLRPLTATEKPSRASRRAIALPNPRLLPVTSATRIPSSGSRNVVEPGEHLQASGSCRRDHLVGAGRGASDPEHPVAAREQTVGKRVEDLGERLVADRL